jgi:hypothetical protein
LNLFISPDEHKNSRNKEQRSCGGKDQTPDHRIRRRHHRAVGKTDTFDPSIGRN